MENMLALLEQVELITLEGGYDFELLDRVYKQLIEDDYLSSEIDNVDKVEDVFLIDYEYEFSDVETLTGLAQAITLFARLDSEDVEEDEEYEEIELETGFMLTSLELPAEGEITSSLIPEVFDDIYGMRDYVTSVADLKGGYIVMEKVDERVGYVDFIDMELAYEKLSNEEHPLHIMAEALPEKALAVCSVVYAGRDMGDIYGVELFAIYKVIL